MKNFPKNKEKTIKKLRKNLFRKKILQKKMNKKVLKRK
jgi:hypothetical protein